MIYCDNVFSQNKELLDAVKDEKRLGMHSFHRYYGKLIPAIPKAFIKKYTKEGDLVFDPFSGSGTTALEAKFANRNFVGVDINPLSILMCRVKTANYDLEKLNNFYDQLIFSIENDKAPINDDEIPFVINRDHWFKDFVQKDLIKIRRNIFLVSKKLNENETNIYVDFYLCVLSAIVKQVSNADTMHVFPGISKRMRKLEADGLIHINVLETYKRACKKRISYVRELGNGSANVDFILGNSADIDLNFLYGKVDLIVTNPPYISSVRYAETLKLELYWMGVCKTAAEYAQLSKGMIGNDHFSKKELTIGKTGYKEIDDLVLIMEDIDKKQSKVIYEFFSSMEKVIIQCSKLLKKDKYYVMKISDSKIRKIKVPTGKLLTIIAEQNGFELVDMFNDKINENSRSLLTARNTYSDIILEDNIVIWKKK